MSLRKTFTVYCDETVWEPLFGGDVHCDESTADYDSLEALESKTKRWGWLWSGERHYCPSCAMKEGNDAP